MVIDAFASIVINVGDIGGVCADVGSVFFDLRIIVVADFVAQFFDLTCVTADIVCVLVCFASNFTDFVTVVLDSAVKMWK